MEVEFGSETVILLGFVGTACITKHLVKIILDLLRIHLGADHSCVSDNIGLLEWAVVPAVICDRNKRLRNVVREILPVRFTL